MNFFNLFVCMLLLEFLAGCGWCSRNTTRWWRDAPMLRLRRREGRIPEERRRRTREGCNEGVRTDGEGSEGGGQEDGGGRHMMMALVSVRCRCCCRCACRVCSSSADDTGSKYMSGRWSCSDLEVRGGAVMRLESEREIECAM